MDTNDIITFFIAVIGWDAICLQFLIIPFLRRAETLQKDYITSGVLDATLSFIESKKLMPALAKMFVRIREAQCSRRLNLSEDELQEILQQIDYIPDLETAQKAMAQNNKLEALFTSLQKSSRSIWKFGLLHVVVTLSIPASQYIPLGYDLIVMITTIILAIVTFIVAVFLFRLYEKQMDNFLDLLKHNR
jgi:hypothetical protein